MHIPDGFLDAKTAATAVVLSVAGLALALRQVHHALPRRAVPLMGLAGAFVFVAQMINFPVVNGTSGHLIGGVLTATLLGPSAAVVVMTSVLIVQCLLCADGGLLALGANVFNLALVSVLCGYAVYRAMRMVVRGACGRVLATGFAAWCATVLASVTCTGELAWSGTLAWHAGLPAMVGVHMVIGLGEALITMLAVAAVTRARPELGELMSGAADAAVRDHHGAFIGFGMLMVLGLAILVVPHASALPDGLECVARALGFDQRAVSGVAAPMADYQAAGSGSTTLATAWAAIIGMAVTFVLAWIVARLLLGKARGGATPSSHRG